MLSLRSLAHAAAILALAAVGLALGLWLRDPHPGGLAFVVVCAVAVAVLLWRLYRPGGIAWAPRAEVAPAQAEAVASAAEPAQMEPEPAPELPPAPEPEPPPAPEPEQAAPAAAAPRSTGARRIGVPKGKRLAPALVLGAVALAVIAFVAWPDSRSTPKTAARPAPPPAARTRVKPKPKPALRATPRAAPKPRPRPAASSKASARSLGSATLSAGSKGADTRLVQKLLKVPASGKYDAKTEAAVRAFQGKHGLPTTGVVATLTHNALKKAFP